MGKHFYYTSHHGLFLVGDDCLGMDVHCFRESGKQPLKLFVVSSFMKPQPSWIDYPWLFMPINGANGILYWLVM
jgi:hypothetical protein